MYMLCFVSCIEQLELSDNHTTVELEMNQLDPECKYGLYLQWNVLLSAFIDFCKTAVAIINIVLKYFTILINLKIVLYAV